MCKYALQCASLKILLERRSFVCIFHPYLYRHKATKWLINMKYSFIRPNINRSFFLLCSLSILIICIMAFRYPSFFRLASLSTFIEQCAFHGLLVFGLSIILMIQSFDSSIVTTASFVGTLYAVSVIRFPEYILMITIFCIGVGAACGLLNGVLVFALPYPPFFVTIVTFLLYSGLLSWVRHLFLSSRSLPLEALVWGKGSLLSVPIPAIILFLCALLLHLLLNKTYIGRYFVAIGSNVNAFRNSGLSVSAYFILAHTICSTLAGIAGIIQVCRINSTSSLIFVSSFDHIIQLVVIAVLSGVSSEGSQCRVSSLLLSIFTVELLNKLFSFLNIESMTQNILLGIVLLSALVLDRQSHSDVHNPPSK